MKKYNRLGYFIGSDVHLRAQLIYDNLEVETNFVTDPGGSAEAGAFLNNDRLPRTKIEPGNVRIDGYDGTCTLELSGHAGGSTTSEPKLTLNRQGANGADGDRAGTIVFECPRDDSTTGQAITALHSSWSDVSEQYGRTILGVHAGSGAGVKYAPIPGLENLAGTVIEGVATGAGQVNVFLAKGTGSTTTVAGDLTISGSDFTFDSVALTGIQTSGESFSNDDVSLMTSAAIEDKILSYGYSTTSGDMTGVTISVGSGLDITESNTTGGDYSATINLDLTEVGVSGSANQLLTDDGDGTITSEANATYDGTDLTLTSGTSAKPVLSLENSNTDAVAPILQFTKTATGANADEIGMINFIADDNADNPTTFAQIKAEIQDAANASEDGQLELLIAQGGSLVNVLKANSNLGFGTILEFGDGGLIGQTLFKSTIVSFESSGANSPIVTIENQANDANGAGITFIKDRNNTDGAGGTSDGDNLGIITFRGFDSGGSVTDFAEFTGTAVETDASNEAGKAQITVMSDGQVTQRNVITGTGHTTTDKVDIDLGYGSASTVTVPGFISIGGHTINDIDVAGEFVDSDEHLMTAAAINDRIAAVGGGGGGSSKVHVTWQDPQSYLFYLFNNNSWYSTGSSTLALLGTSSSPSNISSSNSEYGARIAIYTAIAACTVNKLTFNWYWSSSALSGTKAFEFAFSKFTPQNGSLGTITMNSITATDNNGNYTEFIPYQETFTFSGGNATLAAGDSIAMHMRTTDGSSSQRVLVYGTITLEAELS